MKSYIFNIFNKLILVALLFLVSVNLSSCGGSKDDGNPQYSIKILATSKIQNSDFDNFANLLVFNCGGKYYKPDSSSYIYRIDFSERIKFNLYFRTIQQGSSKALKENSDDEIFKTVKDRIDTKIKDYGSSIDSFYFDSKLNDSLRLLKINNYFDITKYDIILSFFTSNNGHDTIYLNNDRPVKCYYDIVKLREIVSEIISKNSSSSIFILFNPPLINDADNVNVINKKYNGKGKLKKLNEKQKKKENEIDQQFLKNNVKKNDYDKTNSDNSNIAYTQQIDKQQNVNGGVQEVVSSKCNEIFNSIKNRFSNCYSNFEYVSCVTETCKKCNKSFTKIIFNADIKGAGSGNTKQFWGIDCNDNCPMGGFHNNICCDTSSCHYMGGN